MWRSSVTSAVLDEPGDSKSDSWSEVRDFLDKIEGMRGSGKYDWCDATLQGIFDAVESRQRVSEAQRKAVVNILASRDEELEDYR